MDGLPYAYLYTYLDIQCLCIRMWEFTKKKERKKKKHSPVAKTSKLYMILGSSSAKWKNMKIYKPCMLLRLSFQVSHSYETVWIVP